MIAGILLAAGQSIRFGSSKLLQCLPDGTPLVVAAARNLAHGVDEVIAVVRPGDTALARMLAREQIHTLPCPDADRGMGASLACGVRGSRRFDGWLIALGDMPAVPPAVVAQLAERLRAGAVIVAPVCNGRRGHPVGFGRAHFDALCRLDGDTGARAILEAGAARLQLVPTDDAGIFRDIDAPPDLETVLQNTTRHRL